MKIDITRPCALVAIGDETRLEVIRTVIMRDTSHAYRPVAEFIREHGLVLAESEEFRDTDFIFRRVKVEVYLPPSVRNDVLAGTAISLPWYAAAGAE